MAYTLSKYKSDKNPLLFSDERAEALEEAYNLFLEALNEYAATHELNEEQIATFKEQVLEAYLEKRAGYFLASKITHYADYLNTALSLALNKSLDSDDSRQNITRLFYYNNKRHLIDTYE